MRIGDGVNSFLGGCLDLLYNVILTFKRPK